MNVLKNVFVFVSYLHFIGKLTICWTKTLSRLSILSKYWTSTTNGSLSGHEIIWYQSILINDLRSDHCGLYSNKWQTYYLRIKSIVWNVVARCICLFLSYSFKPLNGFSSTSHCCFVNLLTKIFLCTYKTAYTMRSQAGVASKK